MSATAAQIARSLNHAPKNRMQELRQSFTCMRLQNVPRTATVGDLRRMIRTIKLDHVNDVKIDYDRFRPTGQAYIKLTHPSFIPSSLERLKKTTINSHHLTGNSCPDPPPGIEEPVRLRGLKGRAEAAQRGAYAGNGPGGLINPNGSDVVLYGLPAKVDPSWLKEWLYIMDYVPEAQSGKPACEVYKVHIDERAFCSTSKHLIRLMTVSQAHRLVRRLHMTHFQPEVHGTAYMIRANVVY